MDWLDTEERTEWGTWRQSKPVFSDPNHACEFVTLWIEMGTVQRLPDYEVIWNVPLSERLRHALED